MGHPLVPSMSQPNSYFPTMAWLPCIELSVLQVSFLAVWWPPNKRALLFFSTLLIYDFLLGGSFPSTQCTGSLTETSLRIHLADTSKDSWPFCNHSSWKYNSSHRVEVRCWINKPDCHFSILLQTWGHFSTRTSHLCGLLWFFFSNLHIACCQIQSCLALHFPVYEHSFPIFQDV